MNLLPSRELLGSSIIEIHYKRPHFDGMIYIRNPKDAHTFLRQYINTQQLDLRECFWVILLTNANRVLGLSEVATGTTLGVQPNPKYIFQLALLTNTVNLIIAHSHPSGTLNISENDIRETNKIKRIGKLLDITLVDHIILTSESFVSFVQEDIL